MAKVATSVDPPQAQHFPSMPSGGKWVWRDETTSLEYISNNPGDRQDRRRDRRQKGGLHFQEHSNKKSERGATPSISSRPYGAHRSRQGRGFTDHRSPRQNVNKGGEHSHVTLNDVKCVALDMLSEVEVVSDAFEGIFKTDQFDEFLMCLLNFFNNFFEKRTHEQKPNPMNIEPSAAERQYFADLTEKLEAAQRQVGQAYCVLVMGIGMEVQHHMACGQSRTSDTYKDRSMYETLYSFCAFVVWITFRRKEYETVKKEIGRMLRSDTFNPAIRVKNALPAESTEDDIKEGEKKEKKEEKLSPAEYRRRQGKRPPIKSIINQRSPALVAVLPSPKEEAKWLFKHGESATNHRNEEDDDIEEQLTAITMDPKKFKIGIIGEPLSQFSPVTLTPIGADNEEEEHEDGDVKTPGTRRESVLASKTPQSQVVAQDAGFPRQPTAMSQVTAEALSDED